METTEFASSLREQLRERPYWTTAAIVGVGWILGRSLPLGAVLTVAGIGARAAVASALENVVRDRVNGSSARGKAQT